MDSKIKEVSIKGPSRKRLLTDPNPNQIFVTASPESNVSSDSSSDLLAKKTRELPNLSDCHSCGVRINYTNPRERLQPLDSMWRVVLLCKKCYKLVISSELCSYCFLSVTDENDCSKCIDCKRSVHKECVAKYGSGLGLGFLVCVDCWIPDAVGNSIKVRKRKNRKNDKDPESSDSGLRKAVVAKNVDELAKGVLNAVESKKVVGSCEEKVVDDAEFAFLLHRAINSSPRMSRYGSLMSSNGGDNAPITCYSRRRVRKKGILVDSSSLDVPLICYYRRSGKGGLRSSGSLDAPFKCYSRRRSGSKNSFHGIECECYICKVRERNNTRVSTSSTGLKASNCGSNSDNSLNGSPEKDGGIIVSEVHRYLLKYYRIGKGIPRPSVFGKASDCGSSMDFANVITKDMGDTRDSENGKECHEIFEKCDDNANRFLLKYKRSLRTKPNFICENEDSPLLSF